MTFIGLVYVTCTNPSRVRTYLFSTSLFSSVEYPVSMSFVSNHYHIMFYWSPGGMKSGSARVFEHQVPGGQYSNLLGESPYPPSFPPFLPSFLLYPPFLPTLPSFLLYPPFLSLSLAVLLLVSGNQLALISPKGDDARPHLWDRKSVV